MLDQGPGPKHVSVGCARTGSARESVHAAFGAINLPTTCFLLVFVPDRLDLDEVVQELQDCAQGIPVFGCTTAGQISAAGYENDALLILAFPKQNFRCASLLLEPLRPFSSTAMAPIVQKVSNTFRHTAGWNRLGLIFADGLSKQEDMLISALEVLLDDLPIFGGSAGDGLRFSNTFVLHQGKAHENAAVLLLIETNLLFQGLGFDHFLPDERLLVITRANPDERLVYEINGSPAALEYARLVGCPVEALGPHVFAEHPLLLVHKERHFVRAINHARSDHALSFLAAIDEGLIMSLGKGREIIETLTTELDLTQRANRPPDFILGFDCVLRKLEIEHKALGGPVSDLLARHRVFGFNTYGEQQAGLHMNQTFVGVAFFEPTQAAQMSL